MIPLAVSLGGAFQATLIVCEERVVRTTSSGGWVGAPSAVGSTTSSDIGPWPILLKACTTMAYLVNTYKNRKTEKNDKDKITEKNKNVVRCDVLN